MKLPPSLQGKIRQETYSPKWREAIGGLYSRIDTEIIGNELALNFLKVMTDHQALIHRIVDRAEELAQQIQNQLNPVVLCHSDIHAGNVFIDSEGNLFIVDWDEPILAPKDRDLMFIGGGVGNVWNRPYEEKIFYEGYGLPQLNALILAYYRLERIVEDIAFYGNELLFTMSEGDHKDRLYRQALAMFQPGGVIDIALKTANNLGKSLR